MPDRKRILSQVAQLLEQQRCHVQRDEEGLAVCYPGLDALFSGGLLDWETPCFLWEKMQVRYQADRTLKVSWVYWSKAQISVHLLITLFLGAEFFLSGSNANPLFYLCSAVAFNLVPFVVGYTNQTLFKKKLSDYLSLSAPRSRSDGEV